jgi:hypothetical protein
MNPESADLLDDLTGPDSKSADFLVSALHACRQRRMQFRLAAISTLAMAALGMLAACLTPDGGPPSLVAVTPPADSHKLTGEELLDSLSDQPVALVTWPDGRQQLLAIAPPLSVHR